MRKKFPSCSGKTPNSLKTKNHNALMHTSHYSRDEQEVEEEVVTKRYYCLGSRHDCRPDRTSLDWDAMRERKSYCFAPSAAEPGDHRCSNLASRRAVARVGWALACWNDVVCSSG